MTLRRLTATSLAAALCGVAAGFAWAITAPAAQATPGACSAGSGVTVVVDYGPLGGGTEVGCDPGGADERGSAVVIAAGFSITFSNGQPFVCRIDGLPDASQESCVRTPPADAYWGLFWSDGSTGEWVYSSVGLSGLEVGPGGSIGLRFQDGGDRESPGRAPATAPVDAPKPSPTKDPKPDKPTTVPSPTGAPSPTTTPSSAPSPSEARSIAARKAGDKRSAQKGDGEQQVPGASATPSATPAAEAALAPASGELAEDGDNGSALTLVAAGLIVVLGAAVVVVSRRRRG